MISITEKTLQDLQFPTVLETIAALCNTEIGGQKALLIQPFKDKPTLMQSLLQTLVHQEQRLHQAHARTPRTYLCVQLQTVLRQGLGKSRVGRKVREVL